MCPVSSCASRKHPNDRAHEHSLGGRREQPYRSLGEFLDAGRAKPAALTVAGVPATISQIAFEMLKRAANVNFTFVPYAGGGPAVNDLLGGHVTSVLPLAGLVEQVRAGPLRALASTTKARSEVLPDLPTIAELGYKEYEADFWNGVLAPAKTPKETVSQLADWFVAAMQVPEVKAKLVAQGFYLSDYAALISLFFYASSMMGSGASRTTQTSRPSERVRPA